MNAVPSTHFEPAIHSNAELVFLLEHLEEPPTAALFGTMPVGVNATQIDKTLTTLQQHEQLRVHRGIPWAGYDAIKDSILRYMSWQERSREIQRLTGGAHGNQSVLHPSQYVWDESGAAFKGAVGSDSAEMVRTEILDNGDRRPFTVKLLQADNIDVTAELAKVAPWMAGKSVRRAAIDDRIETIEDAKKKHGSFRCSICMKAEEFTIGNRSQKALAKARMGRHLKSAKSDVARHKLLYRKLYESPDARV